MNTFCRNLSVLHCHHRTRIAFQSHAVATRKNLGITGLGARVDDDVAFLEGYAKFLGEVGLFFLSNGGDYHVAFEGEVTV